MNAGDVQECTVKNRVRAGDAAAGDERNGAFRGLRQLLQEQTQIIACDDVLRMRGEINKRAVEIKGKEC